MRKNGASCSAQGTGVYPHIHVQPYPTSMKITLLQVHDKEYWNFIVQIRQSALLFLWYHIQPVMHHKPHGDIHYAHTM